MSSVSPAPPQSSAAMIRGEKTELETGKPCQRKKSFYTSLSLSFLLCRLSFSGSVSTHYCPSLEAISDIQGLNPFKHVIILSAMDVRRKKKKRFIEVKPPDRFLCNRIPCHVSGSCRLKSALPPLWLSGVCCSLAVRVLPPPVTEQWLNAAAGRQAGAGNVGSKERTIPCSRPVH